MARGHDEFGEVTVSLLPQTAPVSLLELLRDWETISEVKPPTEADFPVDQLSRAHPGFGVIARAQTPEGLSDYRFVKVGPEHLERTKTNLEGRLFSDVLNLDALPRVTRVYDELFASGRPHYWERMNMVNGSPPTKYTRLLLPLFHENGHVEMALGSWFWKRDGAFPQG